MGFKTRRNFIVQNDCNDTCHALLDVFTKCVPFYLTGLVFLYRYRGGVIDQIEVPPLHKIKPEEHAHTLAVLAMRSAHPATPPRTGNAAEDASTNSKAGITYFVPQLRNALMGANWLGP